MTVLRQERLIETEAGAELGDVLRRGAVAEHGLRRITRHEMDQRKHERGDAEQHGDGQQHAANEITQHSRSF